MANSSMLTIVTLHDTSPAFSKKVFEYMDALENLEIKFNVGLVPLEISQEVGIRPKVFVLPQWKLNNSCKAVLKKLRFILAEMQEEFLLLSEEPFKKIKAPKVLSWDLTGHPSKNVVRIGTENRRFKLLNGSKCKRKMIRIALHPRDPHKAFEDQLTMISELKHENL